MARKSPESKTVPTIIEVRLTAYTMLLDMLVAEPTNRALMVLMVEAWEEYQFQVNEAEKDKQRAEKIAAAIANPGVETQGFLFTPDETASRTDALAELDAATIGTGTTPVLSAADEAETGGGKPNAEPPPSYDYDSEGEPRRLTVTDPTADAERPRTRRGKIEQIHDPNV